MKVTSRAIIIVCLLVLILAALAGRCLYLQFYKYEQYTMLSQRQQQAFVTQKPQRGVILDCTGRIFAASNKINTVFAEPRAIRNLDSTAEKLSDILNISPNRILDTITGSKNPGYVKIKSDISVDEVDAVKKAKLLGVGVQSDWQRFYPMGPLACHVVGFVGTDGIGLAGAEQRFDDFLRGSVTRNVFYADAARRPIRLKKQETIGNDGIAMILTIDATIQHFVRSELLKQVDAYQADSAIGIVMEPSTGAVLSLVSLPDFEPEKIRFADANSFGNRAITDPFEPGSVLKPIAAAIGLDAGVVDTEEKIFCERGNYRGKGFGRIGEYRNHSFGDLTVREILVESSNIGMAKIGQRLGRKKLYEGLSLFGFGRKTFLNLPGQDAGLMHPVDKWTGYSETRIPFGQEISVTAIQLTTAFCILANGGRGVQPHIVRAVVNSDGEMLNLQPGQLPGYIIKPEVARWVVTEALVNVVKEGTGKRARLKKWEVFGKTGTANIARSDGKGYEEDAYVASFIGGAPADRPSVVVMVAIRRPNVRLGKGYSGGTVAAPVVKEILSKTLTYLKR